MDKHRPGLDVLVIAYHSPGDLRRFIGSLAAFQPGIPFDLNVGLVDIGPKTVTFPEVQDLGPYRGQLGREPIIGNAPHPDVTDALEALRLWDWPNPPVVSMWANNVGYNEAVNAMAAAGQSEDIGIFNADVTLTEGALDHLILDLQERPDIACVGPRQVSRAGQITCAGIFGPPTKPQHRAWHGEVTPATEDVRDDCPMINGSAMIWRRAAWYELTECISFEGGFDPFADRELGGVPVTRGAFAPCQHYYGETMATYHARAHGWGLLYDGRVTIGHEWHQASAVGGAADRTMPADQELFRELCDRHIPPIEHD